MLTLYHAKIEFQQYGFLIRTTRENGDPSPREYISPTVQSSSIAEDHLWIYELATYKRTHLPNLVTIRMRENLEAENEPNFSSHRWIPPRVIADLFSLNGIELDIRIRSYREPWQPRIRFRPVRNQ